MNEREQGEFDPTGAHRDDPHGFLTLARNHTPVFHSARLGAWCVTRHADIVRVLRDHRSFSAREHNPRPAARLPADVERVLRNWRGDAESLGSLDPPEHTRVRAVVGAGLARQTARLAGDVRATAVECVDRIAARAEFDLVSEFALPYALTVMCRVLGVPDEARARCLEWTERRLQLLTQPDLSDPELVRRCARALVDYGEFARDLTARRRAEPRDDLVSTMLHIGHRGRRLSSSEVAAQIPALITEGFMTTAHGIAEAVHHQLRSFGHWPAGDVDDMAEEGLRMDCPIFGRYRTALRETTVGGARLARGSRVLLLYGSGNRDAGVRSEPERFWPGRHPRSGHLSFGHGVHFCVGAPLARVVMRAGLTELAARLPGLRLVDMVARYRATFPIRALAELRVRP